MYMMTFSDVFYMALVLENDLKSILNIQLTLKMLPGIQSLF